MSGDLPVTTHPDVAAALRAGDAVVALESTIISHGLPPGRNIQVAREIEGAVRSSGAVPATIAVLNGSIRIGLDDGDLEAIATGEDVVKASTRDLPVVLAQGVPGATTVAATAWLASLVGIDVFATGGIGGVHRGAMTSWDESADLTGLATSPVVVVCAGVKSILDVPATLERLETLSVGVVGYRTEVFPGFYVRHTESGVPWRVECAREVAEVHAAKRALESPQALVVANPIAAEHEMNRELHDGVLASGLAALDEQGIRGKDVTPFLLAHFHEQTQGASLDANIALVLSNARLAGEIAVAASASASS